MVRNDEKYQPAIDYYFNEAKGDISTKKLAEMFNVSCGVLNRKLNVKINPDYIVKDYEETYCDHKRKTQN